MKRTADSLVNDSSRSKRLKVVKPENINHAPDCSDPDCDGCDVGEIELTFTNEDGSPVTKPAALELFQMAMNEAASEGSKSNENSMAKRLFDMALEAYDTEKEQDQFGYAQCLIEFGRYFNVLESVKEGVDILRSLERSSSTESNYTQNDVQVTKGRGILVQLHMERTKRIEIFEEVNRDNDSDDEEVDPAVLKKLEVTKQEQKLVNEAIKSFDKVFKADDHDAGYEKQILLSCNDLRQYGEQLDMPFHKATVDLILKSAISYLQMIKDIDTNAFALKVWGACLFYQARADSEGEEAQNMIELALKQLDTSKKLESEQQDLELLELVGHCKMLLSTILTDEDQILEKYQEAIDTFKIVLEQSEEPNPKLAEMVELLDGEGNDDDEEEEEENRSS